MNIPKTITIYQNILLRVLNSFQITSCIALSWFSDWKYSIDCVFCWVHLNNLIGLYCAIKADSIWIIVWYVVIVQNYAIIHMAVTINGRTLQMPADYNKRFICVGWMNDTSLIWLLITTTQLLWTITSTLTNFKLELEPYRQLRVSWKGVRENTIASPSLLSNVTFQPLVRTWKNAFAAGNLRSILLDFTTKHRFYFWCVSKLTRDIHLNGSTNDCALIDS